MTSKKRARTDKTDTSRLKRDRYRKKLDSILGAADDEPFCQLVWAVEALQSDQAPLARAYITFPPEAATAVLGEPAHIPKWDLETLLNERLTLPALQLRPDAPNRTLDCRQFQALAKVFALLRELDNAETGLLLRRMDVLREMPRIGHRQFEWQQGYLTGPQLYRWLFLFGGPQCRSYFENKTGIAIPDLVRFALALYEVFGRAPVWLRNTTLEEIGFDAQDSEAALRLLAAPIETARRSATVLRQRARGTIYQPSQLRAAPLLAFGDDGMRIRAPLRDLIIPRVTSGLYYDVADAPAAIRNEVGTRFETYVRELLAAMLPGLQVSDSPVYRFKGNRIDGPDVILGDGERVVALFECKARKMSFAARFSEDPYTDAEEGFDEIAKGVFQLWRYFSHVRRGLVPGAALDEQVVGVVLTLDNWMTLSADLQRAVLERATSLATAKDPQILAEDRRAVVFCSIEDLEGELERSDEGMFLADLRTATEEKFTGWMLPNIHRSVDTGVHKAFPFIDRFVEVLPWWDDYAAAGGQA